MDGAYKFEGTVLEKYGLDPITPDATPADQRDLANVFYGIRNTLLILKRAGVFDRLGQTSALSDYQDRLKQAVEVGCTVKNVSPLQSAQALEQISTDIVRGVGTPLKLNYLRALLKFALVASLLGGALAWVGMKWAPVMKGYGWVVIGAVLGAWVSVAATRRQTRLDDLPDYLDQRREPVIRVIFIGFLAAIIGILVQNGVLNFTVAEIDFGKFPGKPGTALILGIVVGFGERTLPKRLSKIMTGTGQPE